ncbi:hypothetical protein THAOC_22931, partial [Thalassiosira oceanica]
MYLRFRRLLVCLSAASLERAVDAVNVFNWTPSVSLTASFDVAEGLCPDIAGFRASLNCQAPLQLHTCKAQGADTQFVMDFGAGEIRT